jgi:hypothetical protein
LGLDGDRAVTKPFDGGQDVVVAGLAKAVDAERDDGAAGDRAELGQGRRVKIADGHEAGTRS